MGGCVGYIGLFMMWKVGWQKCFLSKRKKANPYGLPQDLDHFNGDHQIVISLRNVDNSASDNVHKQCGPQHI